jgi:acetyl esterase/lipase
MRFSKLLFALLLTSRVAPAQEPPAPRWTPQQRLAPAHLQAVHQARLRLARERRPVLDHGLYEDFRAVIHVHAEDAKHTAGTRAEVLAAAREAGVRIVMLTDHGGPRPETWHGLREGVLFFAGGEEGDKGWIHFPEFGPDRAPRPDKGLRFLSHVEERYDAPTKGFTGMEICNRHTDALLDTNFLAYLTNAAARDEAWREIVESFRAFPDEVFAAGTDYRPEIFAKWDRETQRRRFCGLGANDAHQNQVLRGVTLDPYVVSFRNLSTHVLARELTEAAVREGLREGHAYVAHDWLCDPTGFSFAAVNNMGVFPMGDEALMFSNTRLVGLTPAPARIKLIHRGVVVAQTNGTNLTFTAREPGSYRLEAWLELAGEARPWIYSNPVYLKSPGLFDLTLPIADEAPTVETRKGIVYATGLPEDEPKHKLDLYVPQGREPAPVFFFVHGGAWRFGDRGIYGPVGYRLAREGILTVVPSYRLAPKNPYPAQIEDVAAAFAWTVRHIAGHGGDTNRLYIGGHSAGGHLTALLALNPRFLRAHQLGPGVIRGVAALSGVYNLTVAEGLTSVFGKDPEVRRDASPLFFIQNPAPPFLVTYCEWDYPTLPAQAKSFHRALRRAGVTAELFFTPRQDHISEMIAFTHDDDPTVNAVLKFLRADDLGASP